MSGTIVQLHDVIARPEVEDSADVVIVGTGAAGAVAARVLVESGVSVVLVEEGPSVPDAELRRDVYTGMRRVWRDMLAEGMSCGLHRIERLMQHQALKARPRRRRLPPDLGDRQAGAVAPNVLDRSF